jgi:uncharacterized protein YndB with AHSA1/START domain
MNKNLIAHASIFINAPIGSVWNALVEPKIIKQYMFGSDVISDWHEGSPIVWKGEWQGKPYEDKGKILQIKSGRMIQYNHFSPLSGLSDEPGNYHTVTIVLAEEADSTRISLEQDNNANQEEAEHSGKNWEMMLTAMKKLLEQ